MELRRLPIHQSLTRPQLLGGCDRELAILLATICFALGGPAGLFKGDLLNFAVAVATLAIGIKALAFMAKRDPHLRIVYVRSLRYGYRYSARSRVLDQPPPLRRWC